MAVGTKGDALFYFFIRPLVPAPGYKLIDVVFLGPYVMKI
jgi:hypothetical protein